MYGSHSTCTSDVSDLRKYFSFSFSFFFLGGGGATEHLLIPES
jgi:hypothetical protein